MYEEKKGQFAAWAALGLAAVLLVDCHKLTLESEEWKKLTLPFKGLRNVVEFFS